jgi:hypothetical protein
MRIWGRCWSLSGCVEVKRDLRRWVWGEGWSGAGAERSGVGIGHSLLDYFELGSAALPAIGCYSLTCHSGTVEYYLPAQQSKRYGGGQVRFQS